MKIRFTKGDMCNWIKTCKPFFYIIIQVYAHYPQSKNKWVLLIESGHWLCMRDKACMYLKGDDMIQILE